MSLTTDKITALAPDQASLKAANKLMKASKWPALETDQTLVWGECQGSGANPYRTVFSATDYGYKCTCPSRKFPCKHVLALMWMYVEDPGPFAAGSVPQWVTDWLGRRRTSGAPADLGSTAGKSLSEAKLKEPEKPIDPKAEARKKAAAEKRAAATQKALEGTVVELEDWMADQLRAGLGVFLSEATERCRTIAARLVDGKAQALASRLDELPARLMALDSERRVDAVLQEFSRIVLICRAWTAQPDDPELRRLVATSETRETVLENSDALRQTGIWEVIGERISTRRDGLVSQSTWLLNTNPEGPRFAQLLDFFPAALGKRTNPFVVGEQFEAEMVYFPARVPVRAVLGQRKTDPVQADWPEGTARGLQTYRAALEQAPWLTDCPLHLGPGRLTKEGRAFWWQAQDSDVCLPVKNPPPVHLAGMAFSALAGIWDGTSLSLLSGQSADWGRIAFDD